MAEDVARVANRCEDAKESKSLDLSSCRLAKMPDAIYHILREIPVVKCNLDDNILRILPRKFCSKFIALQELTLSGNRLTGLPVEMVEMVELRQLDISRNQFTEFPSVIVQLPLLRKAIIKENEIKEIDIDQVREMKSLNELDLRGNPLPMLTSQFLARIDGVTVHV